MKPEGQINAAMPWGPFFLPKPNVLLRDDMCLLDTCI